MLTKTFNPKQTAVFPLIADPAAYNPSSIDLLSDSRAREIWLGIFERHTPGLVKLCEASEEGARDSRIRSEEFGEEFTAFLSEVRANPRAHGHPSVMLFCTRREELLRKHGFADPYLSIKRRENDAALKLLPGLLAENDGLADGSRLRAIVEGIFAGNIFDLGCEGTIAMYESGDADFHRVRQRLPQRPWCVDDFDSLAARLGNKVHRKAVVFVDNAGADVVLGMVPFVRELLRRGTRVVLTANANPALNDITYAELAPLIEQVAGLDTIYRAALREGTVEIIPSGNGMPLINLSRVSPELAEASRDADLLVLEGMGRSLESNYRTRFTADTLKVAMVKEQHVAQTIGTKMYGVVCRFEPFDKS